MKKFWRDCKGMVTVMVTLLLIPSILVSGTAVDLARIYSARSVVQDANQLAANAALASYDALLQDLYGLYGIMEDDPVLAGMLDEYIKVSVFGQENRDKGLGTYQLFYGSNLSGGTPTAASGQNLANTSVLRRQIEEYAKFRAPAVLLEELLDRLDSFKKIQKDGEIIKDKMELDEKLEDLEKTYKKIYDQIKVVNGCAGREKSIIDGLNTAQGEINTQLNALSKVRDQYTYAMRYPDDGDLYADDKLNDISTHFDGIVGNVKACVAGGTIKTGWQDGYENEKGEWVPGKFTGSTSISRDNSIEKRIEKGKTAMEDEKDALEKLVKYCGEAESKRSELSKKVDALERKINAKDGCSEELKNSLTKSPADLEGRKPTSRADGQSPIEVYRSLLKYAPKPMAEAMQSYNRPQIQSVYDMLDTLVYGDQKFASLQDDCVISYKNLKELNHIDKYSIDYQYRNNTKVSNDPLDQIALLGPSLRNYKVPDPTPKDFQDASFDGTHNKKFYEQLEDLFANSDSKDAKKKTAKKAATKILKRAQDVFKGLVDDDPEGAWHYKANTNGGGDAVTSDFGTKEDWSKEGKGKDEVKNALNSDIVKRLADLGDKVANKAILLTYDSEMFSNYTTNKRDDTEEKSMAGIPFGLDVNYFYQSELEYLYAGNLNDAKANLQTVKGMIFLVRFVLNYIKSFSIDSVNELVHMVRDALSGISGPFAFLIAELVRLGLVLGESALDVGRIRSGDKVALLKNNNTWVFSVSGLVNAAKDGMDENFSTQEKKDGQDHWDDNVPITFTYRDYLRVFLLFVDGTVLAERTKNLIELNMTNKINNIGSESSREARESKMTNSKLYQLSKAITGFEITTTVDLKMLFLSMPFASEGVNGVLPPGTVPISVTDYRGY